MTSLPNSVTYGTITGTLVQAVIDATDSDTHPDSLPLQGTIVFTPSVPYVLTRSAPYQIITLAPIKVDLNASGSFSVELVATDSANLNPVNFTWTASYNVVGGGTNSFSFYVPGGSTQDVSTLAPVPTSSGTPVVTGPVGPASSLTVGTVTTGAAGSNASVSITGTAPNQTVSFTIPQGVQGVVGPANSLTIGTVTTGAVGASAVATITGTAPNQTLNLTLPTGATGPTTTITVGTVTSGAAGSAAAASITGTAPNLTLNLTIPRGADGAGNVSTVNSIAPSSGNVLLNIGGQNYITNSAWATGDFTGWNNPGGFVMQTAAGPFGGNAVKIDTASYKYIYQPFLARAGVTYTLTYYFKADAGTTSSAGAGVAIEGTSSGYSLQTNNGGPNSTYLSSTTWVRRQVTFTQGTADSTVNPIVSGNYGGSGSTGNVYFANFQLEIGNVPTAWSPKVGEVLQNGSVSNAALAAGVVTSEKLSPSVRGPGLILNPSFEDATTASTLNAANWTVVVSGAGSTGVRTVDITKSTHGAAFMTLTPGGSGSPYQAVLTSDLIPITGGASYYAQLLYGASASSTTGLYFRINWFQANGTTNVSSTDLWSNGAIVAAATCNQLIQGQVAAPATAAFARVQVFNFFPATAVSLWVDYVDIQPVLTYPMLATSVVGTAASTLAAGNDSRIVGAAQKANNLSDLASASTARTNLGLGGAAVLNIGTAASTVAAGNDSRIVGALQVTGGNVTGQINLSNFLTLVAGNAIQFQNINGSVAGFINADNNYIKFLNSSAGTITMTVDQSGNVAATGGISTGGTVRITNTGDVSGTNAAIKTNNLSDLASASTARTNLGLGNSSTLNVGTAANTVAAGNDQRLVITQTLGVSGNIALAVGQARVYNDSGKTLTFLAIRASVGTAPVGAALIVDVSKGGTTIFTTQANRPTIAAGTNTALSGTPTVTTWESGTYLTVDVDQIGSTTAGADLTVQIWAV